MSEEKVYICDVTGDQYPKDELVPIQIKEVTPESRDGNKLRLRDGARRSSSEHVAKEILSEMDLQSQDFKKLEIVICGDEVVAYRDYSPYVSTSPQNPTDEQQQFLRTLTHLPEHDLSCQ